MNADFSTPPRAGSEARSERSIESGCDEPNCVPNWYRTGESGNDRRKGQTMSDGNVPLAVESESAPEEVKPTVVGIGASAGGLAALKQFFQEIPPDTGLVFVVVVHLA